MALYYEQHKLKMLAIFWGNMVSYLNRGLSVIGGGPTPFLYTHLVYIWQKSDGHVH